MWKCIAPNHAIPNPWTTEFPGTFSESRAKNRGSACQDPPTTRRTDIGLTIPLHSYIGPRSVIIELQKEQVAEQEHHSNPAL
jgi:hypothetical protein